jgi:hypothetical protein
MFNFPKKDNNHDWSNVVRKAIWNVTFLFSSNPTHENACASKLGMRAVCPYLNLF